MEEVLELAGKVALVTGGSRGIGAAIARRLARRGARVIVNYLEDEARVNRADAERLAAEIKAAALIAADVGDDAMVLAMFDKITLDFGSLDILINNAGILRDRTIKKMTDYEWESVLRVNLSGAFHCIHHAIPLLRPASRIVNISSVNALVGLFGTANYASAKAGLLALTKTAARELARDGTTVNAVAPGFVDTEMTRGMPAEVTQNLLKQIPLARMAGVDDIAHAVAFLCSPESGYITGQVLHVNGGYLME
jgi:3-oxoacyl-[acyl-carrier protein] reductase